MWLQTIFAREFGFSDVQSNYSRVYAWMANQLGHMTLGLATVLIFVWIVETTETFTAALLTHGGFCGAIVAEFAQSWVAGLNIILLAVAMLVIGVGVFFSAYSGLCRNEGLEATHRTYSAALKERYYYMPPLWLRAQMLLALGVGAAVIFVNWPDASLRALDWVALEKDGDRVAELLRPFSTAVAVAAFAVAIATLCRDSRFTLIGAAALFGVWWLSTAGAGFEGDARRWWGYGILIGFLIVANFLMVMRCKAGEAFDPPEARLQVFTNAAIAGVFVIADIHMESLEWRLAFAGAIASITLWWVKEFASDLPNVHLEIATVDAKRTPGVLGDCRRVEVDYFADARMDARTDGLFYLAGVWIGAGVACSESVLKSQEGAASWASGSEILGLLLFLAVFLIMGRNWAFRQLALDRIGAIFAGRLGVFHGDLRLKALEVSKSGHAEEFDNATDVANPLTALSAFADDVALRNDLPDAEKALNGARHLIIYGAPGSGRSPLGRAIASEAAISDYPTRFRRAKRPPCPGGDERTARYISADRLMTYLEDIQKPEHAAATPTIDIFWVDGVKQPLGARPSKWNARECAASLVVIDDVNISDLTAQGLAPFVKRLMLDPALGSDQKTVWLVTIDDAPGSGVEWEDRLRAAVAASGPLIAALSPTACADDHGRIGVGIARPSGR